ncbi:MAG: acyltransferase domain-containing protein [Clostridia bacterium]|nr:acyltransferase domain-containing protein [Clostridia bacterium]
MKHNTQFIQDFMKRYEYPEEAIKEFTRVLQRLDDEEKFGKEFDIFVNGYMYPEADGLREALDGVSVLAEKYEENDCTMEFVFLLLCAPILKERYDEKGIDEQIFWDSANDFRYKLMECIECEGVPGTFVAGWNDGFFKMERFAYGRFQYEVCTYMDEEYTLKNGKVLKPGDKYVNFHIPSSGVSLTDDVRLDSYKKAYPHYKHLFPDGLVVFGCHSWLLYPKHREFLPKHLNILKFMDDFEIISSDENEGFSNDWRVFGRYTNLPYDQLPQDTSLRKAYAQWLMSGHNGGNGYGFIVFDGEKIIR